MKEYYLTYCFCEANEFFFRFLEFEDDLAGGVEES